MKTVHMRWWEGIFLSIFFALIAMVLLSPISSNTFVPNLWDFWNHIAAISHAKASLIQHQFPLRVDPKELNGWLYPYFQFYSSTSYTVAAWLHQWLSPENPFIAYKLTIGIAAVIGGIYFYFLAFWLIQSKPAALLASVAYLFSPYYIIVINHMGGFNEAIALGILPVTIYYTFLRYHYPYINKFLLLSSLSWYLLATIHLQTFFYTSLVLGGLFILMTLMNKRHWLNFLNLAIAYLFGCILALWYLGPVALFGKYLAIIRTLDRDIYAPSLSNLFSPGVKITNGVFYPEGFIDVISQIYPNIGLPIIMSVGVCIYYLFFSKLHYQKRGNYWLRYLLFIFFIALIMVWSPFNFWQWVPQYLKIFQYSWRILSQVSWVGALLLAWAISKTFNHRLDIRHVLVGMIFLLLSGSGWLQLSERSYVDIKDFIRKPFAVTNINSYAIDPSRAKHLIHAIDRLSIEGLLLKTEQGKQLKLDASYELKRALAFSAGQLSLQGKIPKFVSSARQQKNLLLLADRKLVEKKSLKPGKFQWEIPISKLKPFLKGKNSISLQFEVTPKSKKENFRVMLDQIELNGFIPSSSLLTLRQVEPHCKLHKVSMRCKIYVPETTLFLELPALYYPEMLEVFLNGQQVPYMSMLYQKFLLTAIEPKPGSLNEIKIRFRGLLWANYFSELAWGLWGLFFIYLVLRSIRDKLTSENFQSETEMALRLFAADKIRGRMLR